MTGAGRRTRHAERSTQSRYSCSVVLVRLNELAVRNSPGRTLKTLVDPVFGASGHVLSARGPRCVQLETLRSLSAVLWTHLA